MGKVLVDKALLNVKEVCDYLGIGETKARELLTKTNNNFTVRIGNRIYANKIQLDKWIQNNSGNRVAPQRRTRGWVGISMEKNLEKGYTRGRMEDTRQEQRLMGM